MMEMTVDNTGLSINLLNIRNNLSVKNGRAEPTWAALSADYPGTWAAVE